MKRVLVSGGFDPLHSGHLDMFAAAKAMGDWLIVAVNSDDWLINKKGFCFLPAHQRMRIIKECRWVDEVVPAFVDERGSIAPTLLAYRPDIFANGGDRTEGETPTPEKRMCHQLGIGMAFNVGGGKTASSSEFAHLLLRHEVVQRPWGRFTVIRRTPTSWLKLLEVNPGQALSYQSHEHRSETWVGVAGEGRVVIEDNELAMFPGRSVGIDVRAKHRLINIDNGPLIVMEIALGRVDEGDIVRHEDRYGRA